MQFDDSVARSPATQMTDTDTSPRPRGDGESGLDLDEWVESYRSAEVDASRSVKSRRNGEPLADISPLALLYTGFFLGPGATFAVALWLMRRRITWRGAAFSFGVCGAAWCAIQAATFGLAGQWAPGELQILRTASNFSTGLALLWSMRAWSGAAFGHDRQTWINTAVLAGLLLAVYVYLPDAALVWLGR